MNKILIGKNENAAQANKRVLNNLVSYLQALYDGFAAVNIVLSLPELVQFVKDIRYNPAYKISDFVKEKLISQAPTMEFGGIKLDKEKLKELISLPDLSTLDAAKNEAQQILTVDGLACTIREDLLAMADNGKIAKVPGAEKSLDDEFTYYTSTAKGAELAKAAIDLCKSLNHWMDITGKGFIDFRFADIPGLKKDANTAKLVPDVTFIQNRDK